MEKVTAKLRFLKIGPQKVRLVVDLVRGKKISEARRILKVLNKISAKPVLKLIDSAVANAKHNYQLKEDSLIIKKIVVNEGPVLKRWMPKAHGRATSIIKRSSHIELVLEGEKETKETKVLKNKLVKKAEKELKVNEVKNIKRVKSVKDKKDNKS